MVLETGQACADGGHVRQAQRPPPLEKGRVGEGIARHIGGVCREAAALTPLPACGERSDRASDPGEGAVSRV